MKDCLFCKISKGEIKSWKVYENESVFAFLDINPVNEYHTIVIPKKHYEDIFDVPEKELQEVVSAIKKLTALYSQKLGIKNVQIINNSGAEAQQDVFHLHFHIVPRKNGDNQDIKWTPRIELREKFDQLLNELKND